MTITVKDQTQQLVVPAQLQRRAGFKTGDQLEFKASRGVITIAAKPVTADDEYTPEQRQIIEARLAKADQDIREGRVYGPFDTADEMIASMKEELKKKRAKASRVRRPA